MKKQKPPEFDSDLLASIPSDEREEFKTTLRKNRYLASGHFFFMWHFCLLGLSFPLIFAFHELIPQFDSFMRKLLGGLGLFIESFFVMIILGFLTKELRTRLNQKGIHAVHIIFILIPLLVALIYYFKGIPNRGY